MPQPNEKQHNEHLTKIFVPCLKEMRLFQIFVLLICTIAALVDIVQPYLVGKLVDSLDKPPQIAMVLGGMMLLMIVLSFILNYTQNFFWFKLIHQGTTKIRIRIFSVLLKNPIKFFNEYSVGDLNNCILNDSSLYASNKLIATPIIILNGLRIIGVFCFL